jgi:FkbM family methyltransferase
MNLLHTLRRLLDFTGHACFWLGRKFHLTDAEIRVAKWYADEAEDRLRLDYKLENTSVVVDLGGYEGRWTSDIFSRFRCRMHVFEPVHRFAEKLRWRFRHNPLVTVHECGLASKDEKATMFMGADGTSIFRRASAETVTIELREAATYLTGLGIDHVDLMKINIEGGEYDLLDHLIASDWITNIREVQVQFHDFVPDAQRRMAAIKEKLQATHQLTYEYPFVWENWRLK